MNDIYLEIKDFGQIDEAKINIKKINVVGGVNASGKSTASKLFYCFLRSMSQTRNQYILEKYLPKINNFINMVENPHPYAEHGLSDKFTVDDNLSDIIKTFDEANEKFDSIIDIFEIPLEYLLIEKMELNRMVTILKGEDNKNYLSIVKSLFESESLAAFKGSADFYFDSLKCSISYEDNDDDDLDYRFRYNSEGSFDLIPDVFYIDSISIFDLKYYLDSNLEKEIYNDSVYKEHIINLLKVFSQSSDVVDEKTKIKIKSVTDKISKIIKGYQSIYNEIYLNNEDYYDDLIYVKIQEIDANISSGIQQIGIVEQLLALNKLKPGVFLIIDEPEVNLHPEWQIKFAEMLVIIVKELDVKLYLNSHSPMFIEAISLYSQYYDLLNETNFYLTEKQNNNKYNFKKIHPKNMGLVYENLTKPYDELDKIKAKILFKE